MTHEDKTKELGTKNIKPLLWKYAIPSIISMIIASVYNIVDRIFIGQGVGALAIAGLAITFPLMNIIHALGSLIGVGASARLSIVLGQKNKEWAEKILGNSLIFTFILSGISCTACYLFLDDILFLFGATAQTVSYAREYMMIVIPGMFLTTVSFNLTGLMRASGYPKRSMFILVIGAVVNIVLDPIFIFGMDLGIAGAAWATTFSMSLSTILSIIHFSSKKSFIRFHRHGWAPKLYIFRNITLIGMSPFLMNLASAAVVAILNTQLIRYGGDLAVGAYGIVNSVLNLLVLFFVGFCQGMQPIAGFNYGAGYGHRLKEVYKLTMQYAVSVSVAGMLIGLLLPQPIARAFTNDESLIGLSVTALRFMTVFLPFIAFTIVNSNFFQSIDKPWIAIITSLSRQVLFLIPCVYLVPTLFEQWGWPGLNGIFCSATISDLLGAVLAALLLYHQRKVFSIKPSQIAQ